MKPTNKLAEYVAIVLAVVLAIQSFVLWARLRVMPADVLAVLRELQTQVTEKTDDRFRGVDMRLWLQQFKERNPSLDVPLVEDNNEN